jgi:hypothetical protein
MTIEPQPGAASGLVDRVKNILLQPQAEWERIAAEPADIGGLYTRYALPLAALAAICAAIGGVVFGYGGFMGVSFHLDPVTALVGAVVQVVSALVGVFLLAIIVNALAPNFGSTPDIGQAHKLSVYAATASFVAGCLAIIPALAPLGILGLYSLFLLYVGLPRLMKTPEDKRVGYFITVIIVAIVLGLLVGIVTTQVRSAFPAGGFGGGALFGQTRQEPAPEVHLPNGGSVNLNDLQRQAEQMQQSMQQNASVSYDPATLQGLLPAALPSGFNRSSVSSSSGGAAGMAVSQAEAQYARGSDSIDVTIAHMGAASGLAQMGAALGVQSNREDADGYERVSTVDGRTVTEELSRGSQTAKYMVITRTGVAITAEGRGAGVTADDVRNAVNAVGVERVEALPPSAAAAPSK